MYKTIGVVAHVDAGKTTFSEQLLYHTDTIRQRGRVDHQNSFLDNHAIEKRRGITVFADQASFSFGNSIYTLIDTPGHVDFSPEMERAVQIMDAAIMIISATDGIQGHTETVWHLLQKYQVPTFFFLNKTDREEADVKAVLQDIRDNLSADVFNLAELADGTMSETLIEWIAERDELLLEQYLEGKYEEMTWMEAVKRMIGDREAFAYGQGSALKDVGIREFLEQIDRLTVTEYREEDGTAARIYKIKHDDKGQRETYLKVMQGMLRTRDEVTFHGKTEKITQIRKYNGSSFKTLNEARAGEMVAVTGLMGAAAGDSLGETFQTVSFELVPTLKSKVIIDTPVNVKEVLRCFKMLDAEDPSLQVVWDEPSEEIHIHVMGLIQLEVLQQMVKDRFDYDVSFGKPAILYKETIRSAVNGYGHFEPLRHYAEVHVKLEPGERDSGISFESRCHPEDLSEGQQNLVRNHIFERQHHGLLTGSALTDLKVTLLRGKGHQEHTSGGDFREATFRALRQGLEKAEKILLEPYYDVKIKVDTEYIGRVLADLQQAYGSFDPPETAGDKAIISGRAPVATFMDYSTVFASFTKGRGVLSLTFGGYDTCHNTEEVKEWMAYDKDADPEYTSTSIFCAKGKGYPVLWHEAEAAMHLLN